MIKLLMTLIIATSFSHAGELYSCSFGNPILNDQYVAVIEEGHDESKLHLKMEKLRESSLEPKINNLYAIPMAIIHDGNKYMLITHTCESYAIAYDIARKYSRENKVLQVNVEKPFLMKLFSDNNREFDPHSNDPLEKLEEIFVEELDSE